MSKPTLITASNISSLIELLYALLVDRQQVGEGKPTPETALEINSVAPQVLKTWGSAVPALKPALISVLQGKHKAEALADLGVSLKTLLPQAKQDHTLDQEDLTIFSAFASYFSTGSATALTKLQKLASASGSPWVVQHMAPPIGDQGSTKASLETLIKGLVGRKDTVLTVDEAKQVRELKPDEYKSYLGLRKAFNQAWRDAISSYVRSSGKDKVPYKDVVEFLRLNGIQHIMPTGFTGLIDDRIRWYTPGGKMIDGIPNASQFPSVVMNKTYGKPDGGDYVFQAVAANGAKGNYFYTSDYKKAASKAKFGLVQQLSKKMPGMRKKWFARVRAFDPADKNCVISVVLELLFEFSARIGSLGNMAAGQPTFGIGTLLVKHAVIDPAGNITLRYKGKDGVATIHKLNKGDPEQKLVILALHQLLDGKNTKERIFTVSQNGKHKPIAPTMVNQFFKALGAGDATVHKIRTVAGTGIFLELMNKITKAPKDQRAGEALLKSMAEAVGKKLNHVRRGAQGTKVTGTTALSAYIDPTAQILFFRNYGLRLPKFLEKFDT